MNSRQPARQALRAATAGWHRRVDDLFSAFDLADRMGYGRFLLAQAAALIPVEQALDRDGVAGLLSDWERRRRSGLVCQDLRALGLEPPEATTIPAFATGPAMLGAVYVLEGSRLGGGLLKRSVPADYPTDFLGGGDPMLWRSLLDLLDGQLSAAQDIMAAGTAACDVFALFEEHGRRILEGKFFE